MSGSRYISTSHFDYCFTPIKVFHHGEQYVVPCGKCDGCLLHKANVWSTRLGNELDSSLCSLFLTLTYNNKYLPTLVPRKQFNGSWSWISDHAENIRYDGKRDKLRVDGVVLDGFFDDHQLVRHPENKPGKYISYASKRDVQLWLKMVRKSIELEFKELPYESKFFRYYIISEYGPTHYRNHLHCLLFFQSHEVATFVLEYAAYENWKMCDKTLFADYSRFCNSGVRNYVTNYVTGFSKLPKILKESEIRPFRLASKGYAIGFNSFDQEEFLQSIFNGTVEYTKSIERLGSKHVLRYPAGYISSVFPKCDEFSLLDFAGLYRVYGKAFYEIRVRGWKSCTVFDRLRKNSSANNYRCARKCYEFCVKYGKTPLYYVNLLDMLYYKLAMANLNYFYRYQEENYTKDPLSLVYMYSNLGQFIMSHKNTLDVYLKKVAYNFFDGFGIDFDGIDNIREFLNRSVDESFNMYKIEVEDIIDNCYKRSKFNEDFGFSPHIV